MHVNIPEIVIHTNMIASLGVVLARKEWEGIR